MVNVFFPLKNRFSWEGFRQKNNEHQQNQIMPNASFFSYSFLLFLKAARDRWSNQLLLLLLFNRTRVSNICRTSWIALGASLFYRLLVCLFFFEFLRRKCSHLPFAQLSTFKRLRDNIGMPLIFFFFFPPPARQLNRFSPSKTSYGGALARF